MKNILSFIFILFFFLPISFGWAADADLRQDVTLLKTSVENANSKLANAMNQLSIIQQEFASMKGTVESSAYFHAELNRSLREYDQRITALEDKIGVLMTLLKEIKDSGGNTKLTAADEAQTREFQRLLDFINIADYNKALLGFQGFLQKYPKSSLADNAQYWIAESYYSLNDFKKAISEYQVLIQKYPRSPKVKAALLKQGLSFMGLKLYADAKPFFQKVVSDFPNTTEANRATEKIKELERLMVAPSGGISN